MANSKAEQGQADTAEWSDCVSCLAELRVRGWACDSTYVPAALVSVALTLSVRPALLCVVVGSGATLRFFWHFVYFVTNRVLFGRV